jgi:hypothetical protein
MVHRVDVDTCLTPSPPSTSSTLVLACIGAARRFSRCSSNVKQFCQNLISFYSVANALATFISHGRSWWWRWRWQLAATGKWRWRQGGAATAGRWGHGTRPVGPWCPVDLFFYFFPNFFAESHMYLWHTFAMSSTFDSRQRVVCCELVCRKYFAECNSRRTVYR